MTKENKYTLIDDRHHWFIKSRIDVLTSQAWVKFQVQKAAGYSDRMAFFRAVYETLEGNFQIFMVESHLDRQTPERYVENKDYQDHLEREAFFQFVKALSENKDVFTHSESRTPWGTAHQFGITVLRN